MSKMGFGAAEGSKGGLGLKEQVGGGGGGAEGGGDEAFGVGRG